MPVVTGARIACSVFIPAMTLDQRRIKNANAMPAHKMSATVTPQLIYERYFSLNMSDSSRGPAKYLAFLFSYIIIPPRRVVKAKRPACHGRNVELSGRDKYYKSITKRIIEGGRRI